MLREEYGYVIYKIEHKSSIFVLGNQKFTPLELMLKNDKNAELSEKVYFGDCRRDKIENVNRWISENEFLQASRNIVLDAIQKIILDNKSYYLSIINENVLKEEYHTYLMRALCVGPKTLQKIINARKINQFESFNDLESRANTKVVLKNICEKVYDEISGKDRFRIFSNKAKHID